MLPRRHGDSVAVTLVAELCFPSGRINKGLSSQPGHLGIVQCLRVASDNYEARQGVTEPDDEVTIGSFLLFLSSSSGQNKFWDWCPRQLRE